MEVTNPHSLFETVFKTEDLDLFCIDDKMVILLIVLYKSKSQDFRVSDKA